MIGEPAHMKEHHKAFVKSLTPEEMEYYQRQDVQKAINDSGKIWKKEVRKAMKKQKKGKVNVDIPEDEDDV